MFDSIFDVNSERSRLLNLTREEAFLGILLAATHADGHVAREELNTVISTLNNIRLFNHLTELQIRSMFEKIQGILRDNGVGTMIDASSKVLPMDVKETAFALAIDLVLADGIVNTAEKEFIDNLQRILQIDPNLATKIAEVMVIKNRL